MRVENLWIIRILKFCVIIVLGLFFLPSGGVNIWRVALPYSEKVTCLIPDSNCMEFENKSIWNNNLNPRFFIVPSLVTDVESSVYFLSTYDLSPTTKQKLNWR